MDESSESGNESGFEFTERTSQLVNESDGNPNSEPTENLSPLRSIPAQQLLKNWIEHPPKGVGINRNQDNDDSTAKVEEFVPSRYWPIRSRYR